MKTAQKPDVKTLDDALNALNLEGKILDGLDRYYAEHCTFQEGNEEPIRGRATQRDRLSTMFASLKAFNGATLHGQGVGGDVSLTEWTFDMTSGEGERLVWNEVLVRRWEDGKVVSERFYQA